MPRAFPRVPLGRRELLRRRPGCRRTGRRNGSWGPGGGAKGAGDSPTTFLSLEARRPSVETPVARQPADAGLGWPEPLLGTVSFLLLLSEAISREFSRWNCFSLYLFQPSHFGLSLYPDCWVNSGWLPLVSHPSP